MYTDDTLLTFGKHKFTKLCRVPPDYLLQFLKDKNHKELHEYVVRNKDKILMRKNGVIETEPLRLPCKKFAYISEKEAKYHLSQIKDIKQKHKKPKRAYECENCGMWHLTSVPLEAYIKKDTSTE